MNDIGNALENMGNLDNLDISIIANSIKLITTFIFFIILSKSSLVLSTSSLIYKIYPFE